MAVISRMLLDVVDNYAMARSFEYLSLDTTPFLTAAMRLCGQNGFVRGEDDTFFGTPLFAMKRNLSKRESLK